MVLKAEYFTHLISDRKVGETGYPFMINKEGIVLAHPKAEYLLKLNLAASKGMEEFIPLMIAGKSGAAPYVFKIACTSFSYVLLFLVTDLNVELDTNKGVFGVGDFPRMLMVVQNEG